MQGNKTRERCVAGPVKWKHNRDGTITFSVGGKEGQKFILHEENIHAYELRHARRALVCYMESGRNPKVTLVFREPTGRLISQYNSQ